jgi:hypothetical protein
MNNKLNIKQTRTYLCSLFFVLCSVLACENYDRKPQGEVMAAAPVLQIAQSGVWLRDSTETFADKFLVRINWTEARFTYANGLPAESGTVQYSLEMDTADFSEPVVLKTTDKLFADLFSGILREKLLEWHGGEIDTTEYVSFRVKAFCQEMQQTLFSNSIALKVTPTKPKEEEPVTPTIPDVTIRIRKATECTWENIWVYAWGEEEIFGSWAGLKLADDGNGWYPFVVTGVRPIHLILTNNAGAQFDFISDPTEEGCYEITNSTFAQAECSF